jgi:hypothetical protein
MIDQLRATGITLTYASGRPAAKVRRSAAPVML